MFEGQINIYIFNEQKNYCTPAIKKVKLSFQPYVGMKFYGFETTYEIADIRWNIDSGTFQATVDVQEKWLGEDFLDMEYLVDQVKRAGWDVLRPYDCEM